MHDHNNGTGQTSKTYPEAPFANSWRENNAANGTRYSAGNTYRVNSNVTFYAEWNSPTVKLPENNPTRTNYVFDGWYTLASGGTPVTSGTSVTANATYFAHWRTAQEYRVYYNANGGSGAPAEQTKIGGTPLTLRAATPSLALTISYDACGGSQPSSGTTLGGTFLRWNTQANGGGANYNPEGSYSQDANVTLYAQWQYPTAQSQGKTIPTSTRDGYTFGGWFTERDGNGDQVTEDTPIKSRTTVYAYWI